MAHATNLGDERCTCGHLRAAHGNTVAKGHGHCFFGSGQNACSCEKFSWASEPVGGYKMVETTTKEYDVSEVRAAIATLRAAGASVVKMETSPTGWADLAGRPVAGPVEVLAVGRGGKVTARVDGLATRVEGDREATINITVEEAS